MTKKAGRPTMYKEEYADLAYRLTLLGHTDKELAMVFEVSETTINNWKREHPAFLASIKKGKDIADIEVVEALRKRALGYKYQETRTEASLQGDKTVTTEREVPPDPTAIIFWLKNRQPRAWRDKQEIDNVSSDGSMSPTIIERVIIDPKDEAND